MVVSVVLLFVLAAMISVAGVAVISVESAAAGVDDDPVLRPEEGEVRRLYQSILGRRPDRDGLHYWVKARVEGLSLRAVADGFLNSDEYRLRFGAGPDVAFVERVYGNVLGRDGDRAGVDYWLSELGEGLPRTELVILFSESPEHRRRTGTGLAPLPGYDPVVSAVSEPALGASWRPGCPVGPGDLRAVEIDHVDFDGSHRRGTLIVHAEIVADVVEVFGQLYSARYPVEGITPITSFAGDDNASMAANNTSAFNCRVVTGGSTWSRHAYGTAIDINPVQNPFVADQVVLPAAGTRYVDRHAYHPAMIRPGDVVTRSFAAVGWRWGGDFRRRSDYQHFQR